MAYDSKKAPGRDSMADLTHPASDLRSDAKVGQAASRQERSSKGGARTVSTSPKNAESTNYTGTTRDSGKLVRMGGNTKGTDKLKVSTAIAMASKDTTKPAAVNPDGASRDRSARRTAPGVRR